jgi:hypothetical protein
MSLKTFGANLTLATQHYFNGFWPLIGENQFCDQLSKLISAIEVREDFKPRPRAAAAQTSLVYQKQLLSRHFSGSGRRRFSPNASGDSVFRRRDCRFKVVPTPRFSPQIMFLDLVSG